MSLSLFLKENLPLPPHEEVFLSPRFTNTETGQEIPWVIQALHAGEEELVRKAAIIPKPLEFDTQKYWLLLTTRSVLYPNLQDATLQDSYAVHTPEQLLQMMLTPGEFRKLLLAVQSINGFGETMDDKIKIAKN